MRTFFIAAIAAFALTAAASAVLTLWGQSHVVTARVSLHDPPADHVRTVPLWIPG